MLGLRVTSKHKRSESLPDKEKVGEDILGGSFEASHHLKMDMKHLKDGPKSKEKQSPKAEFHSSLKQREILQLERKLQSQFEVRHALEKALGYRSSLHSTTTNESSITKPATELVREIAVLELEVVHLEQNLLSLYRKVFDGRVSSVSPSTKDEQKNSPLPTSIEKFDRASQSDVSPKKMNSQFLEEPWRESSGIGGEEKPRNSHVHRCQSSLSQPQAFCTKLSPREESSAKALRACHSQPLSMAEYGQNRPSLVSLAEHLGTCVSDHVLETPNRVAEDMVKCMSAIYCKLADPPLTNLGLSSPNSSLSSVSGFSPRQQCDIWSPGFRNNSSCDVRLDNPFHVEGLKEFSGPYSTVVEVAWIYRDNEKMRDIDDLLQDFRSLISRVEKLNPRKLNHEEKLAFWINVHNALVMHAFLSYGTPPNNMKRELLLLKAAYKIGGVTVSADTIQRCILGCRISRPGQWLRLLLYSKSKVRSGDVQGYAIEHQEPLLYFGLCTGSHSDPVVRMYSPKRVVQQLETAKEEYIRATLGVRKDGKILLPKLVEWFAKEAGLCERGVMEMVQASVPDSLRLRMRKSNKSIQWLPHNLAFRYLISKHLLNSTPNCQVLLV